jgi:hypothetical protein
MSDLYFKNEGILYDDTKDQEETGVRQTFLVALAQAGVRVDSSGKLIRIEQEGGRYRRHDIIGGAGDEKAIKDGKEAHKIATVLENRIKSRCIDMNLDDIPEIEGLKITVYSKDGKIKKIGDGAKNIYLYMQEDKGEKQNDNFGYTYRLLKGNDNIDTSKLQNMPYFYTDLLGDQHEKIQILTLSELNDDDAIEWYKNNSYKKEFIQVVEKVRSNIDNIVNKKFLNNKKIKDHMNNKKNFADIIRKEFKLNDYKLNDDAIEWYKNNSYKKEFIQVVEKVRSNIDNIVNEKFLNNKKIKDHMNNKKNFADIIRKEFK